MKKLSKYEKDKLLIISDLYFVAKKYKEKLVGKIFLYIFNGKYVEVNYKAENFKHLTGVDSSLNPKDFFKNCIKHKLTKEQINFTPRHPYKTAKKKIEHLKKLYEMSSSECFMQEDITTNTEVYKFGTTDLSFSIMLTEDLDYKNNIKKSDIFVAKSLRDKDCFEKSKQVYDVTYIFVRNNDCDKYNQMLYKDKNNYNIPLEVYSKLDDNLKCNLSLVDEKI